MLQDLGAAQPGQIAALPVAKAAPEADVPPNFAAPLVTGSIPNSAPPPAAPPPQTMPALTAARPPARVAGDKLPATIGGPGLRAAAVTAIPPPNTRSPCATPKAAASPQNYEAAAHWFERAAKQGLAPAQFRLGGLYEKGLGVKKDLAAARHLYTAAADKGNAKAMHNLAVLYAEGIDGKPDYRTAAAMVPQGRRLRRRRQPVQSRHPLRPRHRRRAELAEAYKWFALAASEGDKDAAKKRDEVGARLDAAIADGGAAAVQTWTAEPQPEEAISVKTPAGGWDRTRGRCNAAAAPKRRHGAPLSRGRSMIRSKLPRDNISVRSRTNCR